MVKLARDLTKGNAYATSIHVRTLERERWRVGRMRRSALAPLRSPHRLPERVRWDRRLTRA